jgi:hypothetical protein
VLTAFLKGFACGHRYRYVKELAFCNAAVTIYAIFELKKDDVFKKPAVGVSSYNFD